MPHIDDLCELEVLDADTILETLRLRYNRERYYTYIGDILLSVNPCKPIKLYSKKHHGCYRNTTSRTSLPPHVFWVADACYRSMVETGRNQCVLFSGESGSGKTEAVKHMLRHLMYVTRSEDRDLLDTIVQIHPLLEAFGNASTPRNSNSSRFGKYMELHYGHDGTLAGAKIHDYILQKTRVVHRSPGEKTFHIFYAMFAGMSRDQLHSYFLDDPESHRIIKQQDEDLGFYLNPEEILHFKKMFDQITFIMHRTGFQEEHVTFIFILLGAILHLTNIVFLPCDDYTGVTIADEFPLTAVAKLLGIEDEVALTESLICNIKYIKGEKMHSWKSAREADEGRDALAKHMYSCLFGWVVGHINRNLSKTNFVNNTKVSGPSIGLLDMPGFENSQCNTFDQFVINIMDERLQQYFKDYTSLKERAVYELDGVAWVGSSYRDNNDVLDLIFSRPHGILCHLDKESSCQQSTDETFMNTLNRYCNGTEKYLPVNKIVFGITHYAETVTYNAAGFLQRNRDKVSTDLVACLRQSNNKIIRELFTVSHSATGTISEELYDESAPDVNVKSSPTICKQLKHSLSELFSKFSQADPHFIRCLTPNHEHSTCLFDASLVRRQLLSSGLVELASLRHNGLSVRISYTDFIERYGVLGKSTEKDDVFKCREILHTLDIADYKLGQTKVFLKMWHRDALELCLKERVKDRDIGRPSQASQSGMSIPSDSSVPDYCQSLPHSLDSGHVSTDINASADDYSKRYSVPNLLAYNKITPGDISQRRSTIGDLMSDRLNGSMDSHHLNPPLPPKSRRRVSVAGTLDDDFHESVSMNGMMDTHFNPPLPPKASGIRRMSGVGILDDDFHESVSMNGMNVQNGINESLERTTGNTSSENSIHKLPTDDTHSSGTTVELEIEEDDSWRPYDVFQISERDSDANDSIFKEILKIIRLILYVFLVVAILASTVTSRLSLFLLTSGMNKDKTSLSESMVILLFCICAPMAWNWLMSFMKILFGGKEWPSVKTLFILTVLELLQTCGVSLLVFKVLPSTDFFRGIIVTFAMFQVPSFLQLVFMNNKLSLGVWNLFKMFSLVVAFLCQVGGAAVFTLTDFTSAGKSSSVIETNSTFSFINLIHFDSFNWELPVALGLISLGFWQNFTSGEWSLCGKVRCSFKSWRNSLHNVKETSFFLIGPLKIGLTVLLARLITNSAFKLPEVVDSPDVTVSHLISYSLMYIQIGSGIICTYLAGLACKLHMQRVSFALPLVFSPPVSLAVVYLQCRFTFLPSNWHDGGWACPRLDFISLIIPLGCAGALWVSYCLITSHIWFPKCERMAKIERLFVTPHFNGIFPDFHLCMRRMRSETEYTKGCDSKSGERVTGVTPMLYVCSTMWHETRKEMTQLLKSLYRLDYMHCASRLAQDKFLIRDPDYFDLEIHVIFDDAFEYDTETDRFIPNSFVLQLIEVMEDAARSVVKGPIIIPAPTKIPTPYGGRLVWTMPGQTQLIIHCKNKNKIRHRKRWSQCMYMYYLLGFRLLGGRGSNKETTTDTDTETAQTHTIHNDSVRNRKKGKSRKGQKQKSVPLKTLLMRMPPEKYEQILHKAESSFILCLDGDVDFRPESVKLLMDRMKKNKKVGAVCGRIHPIGSGPMVWYQQFEYAIGHWLQKAAEHVFGCVLCCPGCFSLFRGSALMDDNVLKMYTTKPTEARHYIQFEQGEDRWLCTLLLQQGHRIDYCAGADALTFAPETFNEFFNQRRRWSPSTLANLMDMLESWRETVRINDNISRPYIFYQFILIASTVLAPSTVILMITGSFHSVLGLSVWWSFVLSMTPVVFYVIICLTQKNILQITIAAVLTALYTVVMMIATVGTIISIATESFNSPNVVFLCGLVLIFLISGLLHPQEMFCLLYGALYFLVVPTTFILLTIYYLCNLNNVSWGTREIPKKLNPQEQEAADREAEKKKKKAKSFFSLWGLVALVHELRDVTRSLMGLKNEMETNVQQQQEGTEVTLDLRSGLAHKTLSSRESTLSRTPIGWEPNPDLPFWLNVEELGHGAVEIIDDEEQEFWDFTIKKYLQPIDEDKSHQEQIKNDLILLRNNVVFIYFLLNFLWCVITLQLQGLESELKNFYIINKYEPLSLIFLSIFALVLLLQFISMLVHRWGTFLHLMSSTRVDWFTKSHSEQEFAKFVLNETRRLQRLEPDLEPDPDYGEDDDDGYTSTFTDPEAGDELSSSRDGQSYYDSLRSFNSNTLKRLRHHSRHGGVPILQTIFEQNLKTMQNYHNRFNSDTLQYKGSSRMQRADSKHKGPVKEHEMRQRLYTQTMDKDREQLKRIRIM